MPAFQSAMHALIVLYVLGYSRGIIYVSFQVLERAGDVSTISTECVRVEFHALNSSATVLLLDGPHRFEAMQQLHEEGMLG